MWITLQDEYGIEQNGTRFSDDGGERTILENQSKRGDSEQKEESKKEEPKKDKLEQEEESGQGEPKQEKLKQEEEPGQGESEQGESEQESGDLKDLDTNKNLYSLYYECNNTYRFKIEKDGFEQF